jgi:hypothetical protein
MRKIVLFLIVIGTCIGCSGTQNPGAGDSAPDYEIVSEQKGDASNLKVKSIEVSTDAIKRKELRRIAEEIKGDNLDQDALNIDFYRDAPGQNEGQGDPPITGAAIVVNNEEAAKRVYEIVNQKFDVPPPTDADIEKLLEEDNGIRVIPFAQIEQELTQDMEEFEKEMEQDLQELEQEMPEFPNPSEP